MLEAAKPFVLVISFWMLCLVCLACLKIFKVGLLSILDMFFGNIFLCVLLFAVIVLSLYYANHIFLFKHDKYKKHFAEFDKKKKYLLYYGIYVVSLVVRWATFYLLLSGGGEGGAELCLLPAPESLVRSFVYISKPT